MSIGPFTFNADTLERVNFPGGYFDHAGRAFYMVRDLNVSETPWFSPYTYCGANPNKYSDLSGFEFSTYEQLLIAEAAYLNELNDAFRNALGDIKESKAFPDIQRNTEDGFHSVLFERALENGGKEYAYAFRGTGIFSLTDWGENFDQLTGCSSHYKQAVENARKLSSAIKENDGLIFVGHSKAGGEAAAASMATGYPAYTFNPAAVTWQTVRELNLGPADKVTNYIAFGMKLNVDTRVFGDLVYNLQKNVLNIRPPGHCIFFPTRRLFSHSISTFYNLDYFQKH